MTVSELRALIDEARADFQAQLADVRREIARAQAECAAEIEDVAREIAALRIEARVLTRARDAERPATTLH